jgi:hypothetical protein
VTTLYWVNDAVNPHAFDRSLFVRCETVREAIRFWQGYFETSEEPHEVDQIPTTPAYGPIAWANVTCVHWNGEGERPWRLPEDQGASKHG